MTDAPDARFDAPRDRDPGTEESDASGHGPAPPSYVADGGTSRVPDDGPAGGPPDGGAPPAGGGPGDAPDDGAPRDFADLRAELEELRTDLEDFEEDVGSRTVHRDELESDLRRYVRRRQRRGHARGWGPYLVLLYGTAMTIGAFYLLSGGWAILAMVVIWLSTLGLYVAMVAVGAVLSLLGVPGRVRDAIGRWRS